MSLRLSLVPFAFLLSFGCAAPDQPLTAEQESDSLVLPRKDLRIAVVGAGPSGLTAADTLRQLGYRKVTVFEANDQVGGKVRSLRRGGAVSELGAVFASSDYTLVLGLADRYGIPYVSYGNAQAILDERGEKHTTESFLTSRYDTAEILAATVHYAAALARFATIQKNGFAGLSADLDMPFGEFAAKHGFTPIAEMVRSVMIGFGYGYYETTPALYYMKLIGWLVKLGPPRGLVPAQYYTFPTGFQSIWEAVARDLDVRLGARVTAITRRPHGSASRVQISINGVEQHDFDAVVISAPLDKVPAFLDVSPEERQLFSQVQSDRYLVSLFAASGLAREEALFFHENARPAKIDQVNVWANGDRNSPVFVGYQIARWESSPEQITAALAAGIAGQGGELLGLLLRQEWDYFPRVGPGALRNGFYEKVEALQGRGNVFYVGGTLSFETVEHSARYARALVLKSFLPALF
jgi:predicted NAD/FAD-dependent oxidoreductase